LYLDKEELIEINENISSPIMKDEPCTINQNESQNLPTIVLARPLVDNFKLLRTLECRYERIK